MKPQLTGHSQVLNIGRKPSGQVSSQGIYALAMHINAKRATSTLVCAMVGGKIYVSDAGPMLLLSSAKIISAGVQPSAPGNAMRQLV